MDSPPRNDEWMPLASQQLRLRHLMRIIGLNISCRDRCKLYFTLHHKLNCAPFYRSGDILHYGNSEAILWDNIRCPDIFKSNSKAVCVRVWEQVHSHPKPYDKLIFSWSVWFSGLVLTGSGIDAKHFSNTLIFQLKENCFSSPEHFSSFFLDNNDYLYDNLQAHDPNSVKIHDTNLKELSDGTESRDTTQIDSNSKSKHTDSSLDLCGIRYVAAPRLKSCTRQSYSLEKLLRVQQVHRSCKRLKQDLQYITEQIINHSLRRKSLMSKNRSSFDYLLLDMDEINPEDKLECKELKIKIEQLRFKCNLLEKEYKVATEKNQELVNLLKSRTDHTKNRSDDLQEKNSRLAGETFLLKEQNKVIISGFRIKKDLDHMICKRLGLLGCELKHIYPINQISSRCFTVCNLPFPNKNYLSSHTMNTDYYKQIIPAAVSVTLAFVAHFVEITAIILDKPLRFPQQTKPPVPSKQILYGIRLLDYNIAQLNYDMFQYPYDPEKEIIQNFLKLFFGIIKLGEVDNDDDAVEKAGIAGELPVLHAISRIEDVHKAKSTIQPNSNLPGEWRMPPRRRKTMTSASEDKRYHSEDNLKALAEHCLKHSYSQERLDKE